MAAFCRQKTVHKVFRLKTEANTKTTAVSWYSERRTWACFSVSSGTVQFLGKNEVAENNSFLSFSRLKSFPKVLYSVTTGRL